MANVHRNNSYRVLSLFMRSRRSQFSALGDLIRDVQSATLNSIESKAERRVEDGIAFQIVIECRCFPSNLYAAGWCGCVACCRASSREVSS